MSKETDNISDGFHTFGELYDHRRALSAVVAKNYYSWKSKKHHPEDSPMFEGGYFIVGIEIPMQGLITYHYKLNHWDDFPIMELEHAPKWDGAEPTETVERLLNYVREF